MADQVQRSVWVRVRTFITRPTARWPLWWVVAWCALLAVAAYANTITHHFSYDDRAAVAYNQDVRPDTPWIELFKHDFWGGPLGQDGSHKSYRPITVATFRFNFWLAGLSPMMFHATNIVMHAAVTALFCLLVHALAGGKLRTLVAGSLFAVHAVHVESVASIVGRAELVCAGFSVLALLAYRRAAPSLTVTSWPWLAATIALVLVGTLGKEVCLTTFAALCSYDVAMLVLVPSLERHARAREGHPSVLAFVKASLSTLTYRTVVARWVIMFVSGVSFMVARLSVHGDVKVKPWTIMENQFVHMPPGLMRTLSIAYTHVRYAWVLVCPRVLSFEWGYGSTPPFTTVLDYRVVWIVGTYAAVAAIVALCVRYGRYAALWGLIWAFFAWLPGSNVIVWVGTEYAERLMYLPSMGAVFALCCWLPADLWSRRRARRKEAAAASGSEADDAAAPGSEASAEGAPAPAPRAPSGRGGGRTTGNQVLVVALVLLAAVANLGRTVTYNRCWSNEFNLFSSGVHANPLAARAANNLAVILARGSHHDKLRAYFMNIRALTVLPDYQGPHQNLALLYRDFFHDEGLADLHFKQCVEGRRHLLNVQECHQSRASLLLARLRRGHSLTADGEPLLPVIRHHVQDSELLGGQSKAFHRMSVAELLLYEGKIVDALAAWHEAMRVWEAEAVTKKVSVAKEVLLCVKGDILAKAGMLQAAVAAYEEANKYYASVRACKSIARVFEGNGQPEDAVIHWKNAETVRQFRLTEREEARAKRESTANIDGLVHAGHGYGNSPTLLLNLDEKGHAIATKPKSKDDDPLSQEDIFL